MLDWEMTKCGDDNIMKTLKDAMKEVKNIKTVTKAEFC